MSEIIARKLGGRMALDGEDQVAGGHPVAVIGDRDERPPALAHQDVDPVGASVDRVLDQFLHRAGRSLDHLTSGDPVDQTLGKPADARRRRIVQPFAFQGHWMTTCCG